MYYLCFSLEIALLFFVAAAKILIVVRLLSCGSTSIRGMRDITSDVVRKYKTVMKKVSVDVWRKIT